MHLTTRLPKKHRPARHGRRAQTAPAQPKRPAVIEPESRSSARRGGGPEDSALYSCMCGFAFKAAVTTSVGCPHCGTQQAW
jgi:hypothetical protein